MASQANRTIFGAALLIVIVGVVLLVQQLGGDEPNAPANSEGRPVIIATFSILGDFAKQVAGPDGDVRILTRAGEEVHEWEMNARNFIDIEQADVIFYNGINLEQWMHQVESVARTGVPVIAVGEESGYPIRDVLVGEFQGTPDPHLWMDVEGAMAYVRTIRDVLIGIDPERADEYRENAERYLNELAALDEELQNELGRIAAERRVLITSEAAFQYFALAYDFVHEGIWGLNSEQEGSPQQMARIMDVIEVLQPAAIFWESTISDRFVRSVAESTGVPVVGPLYVDSLGLAEPVDTYIGMMRGNATLIKEALQ